jgi:hypothetical protein
VGLAGCSALSAVDRQRVSALRAWALSRASLALLRGLLLTVYVRYSWLVVAMDDPINVTEPMLEAGLQTLFSEYNNRFDASENDARHFVTRLFEAMQRAQHRSLDLVAEVRESQS